MDENVFHIMKNIDLGLSSNMCYIEGKLRHVIISQWDKLTHVESWEKPHKFLTYCLNSNVEEFHFYKFDTLEEKLKIK